MLVSIITPCLNSGRTIERTILSVLEQKYKNLEYIIVDGKSSDKTIDIIQHYARQDSRIKFISEKDNSMTEALNRGFQMASGEIIASINADDWYEPDALEHVVETYKKKNFQCLIGNTRFIEEGGNQLFTSNPWLCSWKLAWHAMGCFTPESSVFYSRNCIQTVGLFNEKIRYTQDLEFYLRILNQTKIEHTNKILSSFHVSSEQYSCRLHDKMEQEVLSYIKPTWLRKFIGGTHIGSLLRVLLRVRYYDTKKQLASSLYSFTDKKLNIKNFLSAA